MNFKITTSDKETLDCSLFTEKGNKGVLIISSAVGVKRSFYRHIATHCANIGYTVVTFDYRGIGGSAKVNNPKNCTIHNWGFYDLSAVIDYADKNFTGKPIFLLGHSIAGQIFPFAHNNFKVKGAYFVAAQNASKTHWTGKDKMVVNLFWRVIIPLFTKTIGSLPGFAYGGAHKLPKYVAKEWAQWGKNENGALGAVDGASQKYAKVKSTAKFISFSDDNLLAPPKAAEALYQSYGSPKREYMQISPDNIGLSEIGHFKFFKREMQPLWEDINLWFRKA